MAYTPTISEVTGGRVDPELAAGAPAVNIDISAGLKYANEAAHAKAQNDWQRYALFQKNLADNIKNIDLNYTGIRPGDTNELKTGAAQFYSKLAENPAVMGNPAKYPREYAQLQGILQGLQTNIAKSKQLEAYATAQEGFREKHPNLINDRNNKILETWRNTPLAQAGTFQWDLPKTIDLGKLSEDAIKRAAVPNAPVVRRVVDPNDPNRYTGTLERVEGGARVDPDKYFAIGKDILNSNLKIDEFGHTPKQAIEDNYSLLPESAQKYFENKAKENKTTPLDEYFKQSWESYYTPKAGKEVSTQFKDEAFLQDGKLNHDLILEAAKAKDARRLASMKEAIKLDFDNRRDKDKADALIRFTSSVLQDAIKNGQKEVGTTTGKQYVNLSLPPLVLEKFATPGKTVTKEGIPGIGSTTTETEPSQIPDEINYLPDSKSYKIIHYEKVDPSNQKFYPGQPLGSIAKDKSGNKVFDKELTKTIGEDSFMATVASSIYDKKESPQAYSYAKELLRGKNLEDYDQSGTPSSGKKDEYINIKGVTIKRSKLEEGAKKYGMSYDDYIKSISQQ